LTLNEYIGNINTSLLKKGYVRNPLPNTYMKNRINYMRRYIAQRTKCLECWATIPSKNGIAEYQSPSDMLYVFDVWYDGYKLDRTIARNMSKLRDGDIPEGVPTRYCFYGGENQPSSKVYLYPTPNEDQKEIKVHTLQLPVDLITLISVCELPLTVQWLVEEGVVLELLGNEERTDPRLPLRVAVWRRKVNENINCRVL
jgi:hypothetical protein